MTATIRLAGVADLAAGRALLAAAGLPVEDLVAETLALIAESDTGVVGCIGVERFGPDSLLRSLAVASAARGEGVGARLVSALEAQCRDAGCESLWLLTIDADAWFAGRGYRRRERRDTPAAIRSTREFSELCPGDAVLMSKRLR